MNSRYDTPSRKTSKKIQQMLERKANQMLLKVSQTLEHSTGLALGSRRVASGKGISGSYIRTWDEKTWSSKNISIFN